VESKGDLSEKELSLLLKALNLDISDENFEQLVKTVDLNGNGTIEYDEFCWMMYELARTDNQGSLADMFPASTPFVEGSAAGGGDTAAGAAAAATTTSSSALMLDFHKLGQNLQKLQNETKSGSAEALELTITPTGQLKPKPPSGTASSEKQPQQADEQNGLLLTGNISSGKSGGGGGGGASEEEQVLIPSLKEKPGAASAASSSKVAVVVMDEENEGTARSALTDRTSASSEVGRKSEHGEEGKEAEEVAVEEEEEEEVEEEETLPDDESDDEDGSLARMRAERAAKKARKAPPKMSIYAKFELSVWRIFHPKQAKAMDLSEAAALKKAAAKERKRLEMEKSDAARNAASSHGPFCFCGCRGF